MNKEKIEALNERTRQLLLGGGEAALQKQHDVGKMTVTERCDARCILDSMKINNTICADNNGIVSKINITVGASVGKDAVMFEFC